jgi:hypothetical protein
MNGAYQLLFGQKDETLQLPNNTADVIKSLSAVTENRLALLHL